MSVDEREPSGVAGRGGRKSRGSADADGREPAVAGGVSLSTLRGLRGRRAELDRIERDAIDAARAAGASWTTIADALGLASRQAAEQRRLRLDDVISGRDPAPARERRAGRRRTDAALGSAVRDLRAAVTALLAALDVERGPDPDPKEPRRPDDPDTATADRSDADRSTTDRADADRPPADRSDTFEHPHAAGRPHAAQHIDTIRRPDPRYSSVLRLAHRTATLAVDAEAGPLVDLARHLVADLRALDGGPAGLARPLAQVEQRLEALRER